MGSCLARFDVITRGRRVRRGLNDTEHSVSGAAQALELLPVPRCCSAISPNLAVYRLGPCAVDHSH
jgi:hypothetical protein